MTVTDLARIIDAAIADYQYTKVFAPERTEQAINDMENVYIMVYGRDIPGSDTLGKTILRALKARKGV